MVPIGGHGLLFWMRGPGRQTITGVYNCKFGTFWVPEEAWRRKNDKFVEIQKSNFLQLHGVSAGGAPRTPSKPRVPNDILRTDIFYYILFL